MTTTDDERKILEAVADSDPDDLVELYGLLHGEGNEHADTVAFLVDGLEFDNYILRRSNGHGWDVLKGLDHNDLVTVLAGV